MKLGIIFTLLVILAEALGLTAVGLIITLTSKYWGGYAWDGGEKQFNLHPALMVVGFLFFYGNCKSFLKNICHIYSLFME